MGSWRGAVEETDPRVQDSAGAVMPTAAHPGKRLIGFDLHVSPRLLFPNYAYCSFIGVFNRRSNRARGLFNGRDGCV